MFIPGLVSVSFRKETVETVIHECVANGLKAVEWGGDIHVPPEDPANAARVGELTRRAGLSVAAYGSYFRLGTGGDFAPVLTAAEALGAPVIRIWAGTKGSLATSPAERAALRTEALSLADKAAAAGITLTLECHVGTLTDRLPSALAFMEETDHPALKMYWQPNQFRGPAYNALAAEKLAPYTVNCHLFHWDAKGCYPLAEGEEEWRRYLAPFAADGRDRCLLLEFMHDGKLSSLRDTAFTLLKWIKEWNV